MEGERYRGTEAGKKKFALVKYKLYDVTIL